MNHVSRPPLEQHELVKIYSHSLFSHVNDMREPIWLNLAPLVHGKISACGKHCIVL